jgi:hypothetical protein
VPPRRSKTRGSPQPAPSSRARAVLDAAKRQADAIDRTERRFGSPPIMHLARLLDDFYMAADNLICDLESD